MHILFGYMEVVKTCVSQMAHDRDMLLKCETRLFSSLAMTESITRICSASSHLVLCTIQRDIYFHSQPGVNQVDTLYVGYKSGVGNLQNNENVYYLAIICICGLTNLE